MTFVFNAGSPRSRARTLKDHGAGPVTARQRLAEEPQSAAQNDKIRLAGRKHPHALAPLRVARLDARPRDGAGFLRVARGGRATVGVDCGRRAVAGADRGRERYLCCGGATPRWRTSELPPLGRGGLDPDVRPGWLAAFQTVQGYEAWRAHGAWVDAHWATLGTDVAGRFRTASRVSVGEAEMARGVALKARRSIRSLIGDRVLVLP